MPPRFVVAKWDLVDSRAIADRAAFEHDLDGLLRDIPRQTRASGDWHRPPARTAGIDELSSVSSSAVPPIVATIFLNLGLRPRRFRLGLATGDIDIPAGAVSAMDGPAFHLARGAIDHARGEDLLATAAAPRPRSPDGSEPRFDLVIEALSGAWAAFTEQWTEHQARAVTAYRNLRHQARVADHLAISPQAVHQALQRARAGTVFRLEDAMIEWARRYDAEHVHR